MTEWKPIIHQWQLDWLKNYYSERGMTFHQIEKMILNHYEVYQPIQEETKTSILRHFPFFEGGRRGGRESLGRQIEQQYRLAKDREVSGIRNLGLSIGPIYIDEANNLAESFPGHSVSIIEPEGYIAPEWLERRRICRRALSCELSGEAD